MGGGQVSGMEGGVGGSRGERHWACREVLPACGPGLRASLPPRPEWPPLWCRPSLRGLGCEHIAAGSASCGQALLEHHWPQLKGILHLPSPPARRPRERHAV